MKELKISYDRLIELARNRGDEDHARELERAKIEENEWMEYINNSLKERQPEELTILN